MERDTWQQYCKEFYKEVPLYTDTLKSNDCAIEIARLKMVLNYFKDQPKGNLLEVGCQDGYIAEQLRKIGWNVFAIDPNPSFIEWCKIRYPEVKSICGFIEDIDIKEKFDWVCLMEVLEHVCNPGEVIESVRGLLKAGGKSFISLPKAQWGEYPTHYKIWGKKEFEKFISQYFNIIDRAELGRWNFWIVQKEILKDLTDDDISEIVKIGGNI